MAKPPSGLLGADARPRIYFRLRGDQAFVAGNVDGPWMPTSDIISAIDLIAGEDAYRDRAVILWEGQSYDG